MLFASFLSMNKFIKKPPIRAHESDFDLKYPGVIVSILSSNVYNINLFIEQNFLLINVYK